MITIRILLAAGLLAVLLTGCGPRNALTDIRGAVTYDGKPIEKGMIRFLAVDGSAPTAAAEITEGRYVVKASAGKKRVEMEAYQVVGRRYHRNDPKGKLLDTLQQILPDRYIRQKRAYMRDSTGEAGLRFFANQIDGCRWNPSFNQQQLSIKTARLA